MIGRARVHEATQVAVASRGLATAPARLASADAALASSAIVQGALGIEFALSGLNKIADPNYVVNFTSFVSANPGATSGPLAFLTQSLVLPNAALASRLLEATELALGPVFLVGALEIVRRMLSARPGETHGYEAPFAVAAGVAGLAAAGLAFSIFVLMGGVLPTVMPARAFTSAIPVELLIVPLGLSVACVEFGRFLGFRSKRHQ